MTNRKPFLITPDGKPRDGFHCVTVDDFFREPSSSMGQSANTFAACVEGRLTAAYLAPILVDVTHPRFELVGWPKTTGNPTKDELFAMGGAAWGLVDSIHALDIGKGSLKPKLILLCKGPRISMIWKALRFKGYDELDVFWIRIPGKADERNLAFIRKLTALNDLFPDEVKPKWIAIGKEGKEAATRAGITEHVWFKHPDEPGANNKNYKDVGRELGRAGLDNGPWREKDFPIVVSPRMPEWCGIVGVKETKMAKNKVEPKENTELLYLGPKQSLPTNVYHADMLREAVAANCTAEQFGEIVNNLVQAATDPEITATTLKAMELLVKIKTIFFLDASKTNTTHNTQVNLAIMESTAVRDNLADPAKAQKAFELMNLLMPPTGGVKPAGQTFDGLATPLSEE